MRKQRRSLKETVRPRVFIGSSTESLEVARAVQAALYYDSEPVLWSQGVFGLSGGTLETLVAESGHFDFAVFVLSADDFLRKQKRRGNAPRDNVLFELGLFMGHLGRERTFFVYWADEMAWAEHRGSTPNGIVTIPLCSHSTASTRRCSLARVKKTAV